MPIRRSRQAYLLVGIAALVMLGIVGTAHASNMAFRINMTVQGQPACSICDNWISLPFDNQFVGKRLRDLCDTDGDGRGGSAASLGSMTRWLWWPSSCPKTSTRLGSMPASALRS